MAKAQNIIKKKPDGDSIQLFRRLARFSWPYWPYLTIAILANLLYSGIDSMFAYLMKPMLDRGFVARDHAFLQWLPLLIVGMFLLRAVANFCGSYSMAKVGRSVVMTFRTRIFQKLMKLPCRFYDHQSSGQLISLIVYNAAQVSSACTNALTELVQSGFLAIGLITVIFINSWQLGLILLLSAPIMAMTVKLTSQRLRYLSKSSQSAIGDIAHLTEETVESYKVVRIFGGEQYEYDKFVKAAKKSLSQEVKIVISKAVSTSGVQLLGVMVLAIMIYVATLRSGSAPLTAGGFTSVLTAMMGLLRPMKQLTTLNAIIQRGLAGAESIFQILDETEELGEGSYTTSRVQGAIAYHGVSFTYDKCQTNILTDIHFSIAPGQTVAFVGHSGSGKSTLVSLLTRFYDVNQGNITIDGRDIHQYALTNLRQQFALVSQHVTLFNDTIAHNIAYGQLTHEVSEAQVIAAAEAAHAMEFIEALPQGIHTVIGENGVLLSGGQRQRLAIARAILKDAPILILDEATSALDTHSERLIQSALEGIMKNRTTMVIAHRLSTIEAADNIIVMKGGRIIEQGTHQKLLAAQGAYATLHQMQFQDHHNIVTV